MNLLFILATISGALMGASNFPQAIKIFKRKSAKDISILTYSILLIGAFIWVIYGIDIQNTPIIITNALGVMALGSVVLGWFLYGQESKKNKN
ncbi:MAG: SemiSWEET family transporter [Nanoarchaeota archaeon]|mgnify:CR=1 FL=1